MFQGPQPDGKVTAPVLQFFFIIGDTPILLSYPGPPVPNKHIKPGFDTAASNNI